MPPWQIVTMRRYSCEDAFNPGLQRIKIQPTIIIRVMRRPEIVLTGLTAMIG
jgi:hypothetical protein